MGGKKGVKEAEEPVDRIETANDAARVEPRKEGYFNAVQVFPFSPGALYQIMPLPDRLPISRSSPVSSSRVQVGVGRRYGTVGCRRYRKRKWRHPTRPYHGQADAAFNRDQSGGRH